MICLELSSELHSSLDLGTWSSDGQSQSLLLSDMLLLAGSPFLSLMLPVMISSCLLHHAVVGMKVPVYFSTKHELACLSASAECDSVNDLMLLPYV